MVDIGHIPAARSARFSRPRSKVLSKRRTGHEHEKERRDKSAESENQVNDTADKPHFNGYA